MTVKVSEFIGTIEAVNVNVERERVSKSSCSLNWKL